MEWAQEAEGPGTEAMVPGSELPVPGRGQEDTGDT